MDRACGDDWEALVAVAELLQPGTKEPTDLALVGAGLLVRTFRRVREALGDS